MENSFGNLLKELRLEKGLSQKKAAEILGYAQSTYCDWENGKIEPTLSAIKQICILFGVSADELLGLPISDGRAYKLIANNNIIGNKGNITF